MGGLFGPVLANIITTECKNVIVDKLMKVKVIKFHARYADNTLLIIRKKSQLCFKSV